MKSIEYYYRESVKRVYKIFDPVFGPIRRCLAKCGDGGVNSGFTILSNNCWGGFVYRYFALPYNSPTVGLFFFAEEYLRFLGDPRHYLESDLKVISVEDSRYRDELLRRGHKDVPVGVIEDIEIVFLHYHSEEEVLTKWKRRSERVDWDKLIVKMSEQNLCTEERLRAFDALPYPHKIVFVHKDYGLKSQIVWNEYRNKDEVSDDTTFFKKHLSIIKLIKRIEK